MSDSEMLDNERLTRVKKWVVYWWPEDMGDCPEAPIEFEQPNQPSHDDITMRMVAYLKEIGMWNEYFSNQVEFTYYLDAVIEVHAPIRSETFVPPYHLGTVDE